MWNHLIFRFSSVKSPYFPVFRFPDVKLPKKYKHLNFAMLYTKTQGRILLERIFHALTRAQSVERKLEIAYFWSELAFLQLCYIILLG